MVIFEIVIVVVLLIAITFTVRSVRIISEYQRIVLFRLGRAIGVKGPGLTFINPVTDKTKIVDLREQYLEIPQQTAITKDNAPISIDFIIFYKVVDPQQSVLSVENFAGAALNIAATTLRSVVGDMSLDDILSKREAMNSSLRVRLDDVTERWGVKITNVEVREINPPPGVQEAMTRQMSAERTRRAAVTEAEGKKEAGILTAEGERQAAITRAEGQQKAEILKAEGERQAAILKANGYAEALQSIFSTAEKLDPNTILLQYFETLKQIASTPASKIIIPAELSGMMSQLNTISAINAATNNE
jgi:regulator of protease activity HflC (stomatin/prohibitin superfamily)